MSHINLKIYGGLGNQIFQLAASLLLGQRNKITGLNIDESSLSNYNVARYNELPNFFDLSKLSVSVRFNESLLMKFRIAKLFAFRVPFNIFVSDKNFQYMFGLKSGLHMDGYFQKCLTQQNFNQEISLLKNALIEKHYPISDKCIIHIRGGDFVELGWDKVSDLEFYLKAISYMKNNHQTKYFYVVTDDRAYASRLMSDIGVNYEFSGQSMEDDFRLIGSHKFRILSSSTFAFWASALGENNGAVVIAPQYWSPGSSRKIKLPCEVDLCLDK
jgi:hypothetical protein